MGEESYHVGAQERQLPYLPAGPAHAQRVQEGGQVAPGGVEEPLLPHGAVAAEEQAAPRATLRRGSDV